MDKARTRESIRTISSIATIAVAIMIFIANPYHAAQVVVSIIGIAAILMAVAVLIYDHVSWKWLVPKPHPSISWREEGSLNEVAVAWKTMSSAERNRRLGINYPEWPTIADLAPKVVGFGEWTAEAWDKLANWLVAHNYAADPIAADFLERDRVVKALRKGR